MSEPIPPRRIEELFTHAVELAPEACRAWLEQLRTADPDAANQVERLLAADVGLDAGAFVHMLPGFANLPADAAQRARIVRVGAYRVETSIGHGGMGEVYKAVHTHTGRPAAIKLLRTSLTSGRAYDRFRTEAETLARLSDSGIAQLFDAGIAEVEVADGRCEHRPFLAMEFVDGQTIVAEAERRSLSVRDRLRLIQAAARAVQHAHLRGVIHRDLKPSNIIIAPDGSPKVVDFGIAKLVGGVGDLTFTGQILGTARYMSPEQAAGDHAAIDARSDIYSLGAVLYELLARRPVVDTDSASAIAAVSQVLNQRPVRLASLRPELRGNIDAVVHKALEREPEDRYQSAGEFAEDLQRLLDGGTVSARAPTTLERLVHGTRRNKALTAAVLIAASAMIAGTAVSIWQARVSRSLAIEARQQTLRANEEAERAVNATREAQMQARLAEQQADLATQQWTQMINSRRAWEEVRGRLIDVLNLAAAEGEPVREALTRVLHTQLVAADAAPDADSFEQVFGFDVLSEFHAALGDLPTALKWRERSLNVLTRLGHPEDALHLMERARVANLRFLVDPVANGAEAERVMRACREKLTEELHVTEPDSIGLASSHASMLRSMNRNQEAEAILLQQIDNLAGGSKHRERFELRRALAKLYQGSNRSADAVRMFMLALDDGIQAGIPEVDQAGLHAVIGVLHARSGNLDLARSSYQRVYAIRSRLFGAQDCRTLDPLSAIARTFFEQGRRDEAYDLLRPALEALGKCPSQSFEFVRALNVLSEIDLARNQPDAAEPKIKEALARVSTGSFEASYMYGWAHLNDARLKRVRGDLSGAESQALELYHLLGRLPDPPNAIRTMIAGELVKIYQDFGRTDDVAKWRERAGP